MIAHESHIRETLLAIGALETRRSGDPRMLLTGAGGALARLPVSRVKSYRTRIRASMKRAPHLCPALSVAYSLLVTLQALLAGVAVTRSRVAAWLSAGRRLLAKDRYRNHWTPVLGQLSGLPLLRDALVR